ncbi:MAG: substrate-binding domain-containing protein, partial [Calditrichaeota bacterium]|nr:substrate-binding domain-containing protein [Calditrichota bacterium]
IEDGCRATRDLLAKSERPTAVFYSGDLLAIGGLMAAEREGLSVPGDFSVVGFDDILSASVTSPPLTTVRVDKERIGQTAVELLFRLMEDPNDVATVYVPTELIVRGSTARIGKAVQEPEAV